MFTMAFSLFLVKLEASRIRKLTIKLESFSIKNTDIVNEHKFLQKKYEQKLYKKNSL